MCLCLPHHSAGCSRSPTLAPPPSVREQRRGRRLPICLCLPHRSAGRRGRGGSSSPRSPPLFPSLTWGTEAAEWEGRRKGPASCQLPSRRSRRGRGGGGMLRIRGVLRAHFQATLDVAYQGAKSLNRTRASRLPPLPRRDRGDGGLLAI